MKPAVETLIETYRNNLYVAAFQVCRNAQDAEDVVQDTFIQYWTQNKEFESQEHIRAWLLRVAINKAKNKARSFFRRNAVPLEDYMQTLTFDSEESSRAVRGGDEPARAVSDRDSSVLLRGLLGQGDRGHPAGDARECEGPLVAGPGALRSTLKEVWDDDESRAI